MKKGFTLVELITAISIFIVIMTISMGSIISIFQANRHARAVRTAIAEVHNTLETMAREIKFGTEYFCDTGNLLNHLTNATQDCPAGYEKFTFKSNDGDYIYYNIDNIPMRKVNYGSDIPFVSSNVSIDSFNQAFFVVGSNPTDSVQPKVLIKMSFRVVTGKNSSLFNLQTLVTQRKFDI